MPFTSSAPNFFGRMGAQTSPTNFGNPMDVFSKADATRSAMPNLFSTIQAVRANELERQTKQTAIAQALQKLSVSPEQKMANDLLKIQSALAQKGLKLTPQGIVRDESLMSDTDRMINAGKMYQARNSIVEGGGQDPFQGMDMSGGISGTGGGMAQMPAQATSGATQQPTQGKSDLFATDTNRFGVPSKLMSESGMTREATIKAKMKALEDAAEKAGKSEQTSKDFSDFAGQYQLAFAEVLNDPDLGASMGDATINGAVLRTFGKAKNAFGLLPETKGFVDSIQSFATPLAKTAGEDRLTNEDIQRFTALLPNMLQNPAKTDITKMRNLLLKIKSQGGDIEVILGTFREAGGALSQVVESVGTFKDDVKKAGKTIASKSGFTIVGVRDAK